MSSVEISVSPEYDYGMVERVTPERSLGPELLAIIGTGVAIAALILTVAGWQRGDMRDLGRKIEAIQVGQSEIRERLRAVEVGQGAIRERLSGVESRIGANTADSNSEVDLAAVSA